MANLPPSPFEFGVITVTTPDEAVTPLRQEDVTVEFPDIGEIFVGARKLEPVEMWFENTAYPREDELLYEVLEAMDDPRVPSLREMPYGMEGLFDPPPLFLLQKRA